MKKLDAADLFALVGIVILGVGCWQVFRPLAFIVVGSYLLLCSLAAGRK